MKIMEQTVNRFSNFYPDGSFYVLREKDIYGYYQGIKSGEFEYRDLSSIYKDFAKNKEMYLIPNEEYYILAKKDFLETIPKEIINKDVSYIRVLFLFKDNNYNCFKRGIEFRQERVLTIIDSEVSERIILRDNKEFDNIKFERIEKHDYLNSYINSTSFFKLFDRVDILFYQNEYFLKCTSGRYTLYFNQEEFQMLFLRYQSPDLEDFSIKNLSKYIIEEEKVEELSEEEESSINDMMNLLDNLPSQAAKKKTEENKLISDKESSYNIEDDAIEEVPEDIETPEDIEAPEEVSPEFSGMPAFLNIEDTPDDIDFDNLLDLPDLGDFGEDEEIDDF